MTITFEGTELELVERACRNLAERARRDAENVKGTTIEKIHKESEAQWLLMAERIKAERSKPDPEPTTDNESSQRESWQ